MKSQAIDNQFPQQREQVDWTCKECGFGWIGDYTDFSCPNCDELDIKPIIKRLD